MSINVAADVLRDTPAGWTKTLRVSGAADVDAATAALEAAAARFARVTEHGDERTREQPDNPSPDDAAYTPNWVSVEPSPAGPVLHVDAKDQLTDAMRTRMLAIVVDELADHGITTATVASAAQTLRGRVIVRVADDRYLAWIPELRGPMTRIMDRDMALDHLTHELHVRRAAATAALDQADRTGVSDPALTVEQVLASNHAGPDRTHASIEELRTGQWRYWKDPPSPEEAARERDANARRRQFRADHPRPPPG